MLRWLKSLWRNTHSVKPRVGFDDHRVIYHRPDGTSEEVTWDELTAVEIVTTDGGPFVCDVYFVLHGYQRGCVVPQEVDGCSALLERLQKLPDFNHQAAIDAMCCTANARFPAWQRSAV